MERMAALGRRILRALHPSLQGRGGGRDGYTDRTLVLGAHGPV